MTAAVSPKKVFIESLATPDRFCAAAEAAGLLFPGQSAEVAAIRCLLFSAGIPTPAAADLPGFIAAMDRIGWKVVPHALGSPLPGDIFVVTDDARSPCRIGLVAKLTTDRNSIQTPDRQRVDWGTVEFILRAPGT